MCTRFPSVIEFSVNRRTVAAIFDDEVADVEAEPPPHHFRVVLNAGRVDAFFRVINSLGEVEWISYALAENYQHVHRPPCFGGLPIGEAIVIAIAMNHLLPPVSQSSDVRLGVPRSVIRCERDFQCRRTDGGVIVYDLGTL